MSNVKDLWKVIDFFPPYSKTAEMIKERNKPKKSEASANKYWWKENEEIGRKGEAFVKHYLETKFNAVVEKKSDSYGFDFSVEIDGKVIAVEVKTSGNQNHIFISQNEMRTAKKLRDEYWLYYVSDFDGNSGRLFTLQDPYEALHFEKFIGELYTNEIAEYKAASIRISFKSLSQFKEVLDIQ